jgi:hypothetical protein
MNESIIEPRLMTEIRRREAMGAPSPISVLIQLNVDQPPAESTTYPALAQALAVQKKAVLDCLSRGGFKGTVQENVLAGSLAGELTPNQIATVSDLKQVKRIVLNRLDEVGLGSG